MMGMTILGATGTIGVNTLDVVSLHPERFRIVALTAQRAVDRLYDQCLRYRPRYAVMLDEQAAKSLAERLAAVHSEVEVLAGPEALGHVAALPEVDCVMAAIVGAAGLLPTLAAARAGKRILLANKEALVMAGGLFLREVQACGAELLPIDSEHNAVFQCLPPGFSAGRATPGVRRILLTGSGGPFRALAPEALKGVTPEQACAHPNWVMGRKISVDSATMMNKGLEVIEACWLFGVTPEQVEVVVHPQSVIHSMVEYVDGTVLAQLGSPDMRTPIAQALAWPQRIESGAAPLDLLTVARLDFEPPDLQRFPCLRIAYEVLAAGGTASTVLNAANEIAVDAFLSGRLPFTRISAVIEETLAAVPAQEASSLERVLAEDAKARRRAAELVARAAA